MAKRKVKTKRRHTQRIFKADTVSLRSMRLVAASQREGDLPLKNLASRLQKSPFSAEMIQQLIEKIKTI